MVDTDNGPVAVVRKITAAIQDPWRSVETGRVEPALVFEATRSALGQGLILI